MKTITINTTCLPKVTMNWQSWKKKKKKPNWKFTLTFCLKPHLKLKQINDNSMVITLYHDWNALDKTFLTQCVNRDKLTNHGQTPWPICIRCKTYVGFSENVHCKNDKSHGNKYNFLFSSKSFTSTSTENLAELSWLVHESTKVPEL